MPVCDRCDDEMEVAYLDPSDPADRNATLCEACAIHLSIRVERDQTRELLDQIDELEAATAAVSESPRNAERKAQLEWEVQCRLPKVLGRWEARSDGAASEFWCRPLPQGMAVPVVRYHDHYDYWNYSVLLDNGGTLDSSRATRELAMKAADDELLRRGWTLLTDDGWLVDAVFDEEEGRSRSEIVRDREV